MQNIIPFLWFDQQAEAAAKFYISVFKHSKIIEVLRYGKEGPGKPGSVMTVSFRLGELKFIALNGGPEYKFTHAVSFFVSCRTQKEVDYYWRRLSAGGRIVQCGWLTDKFGLSWQIVPEILLKFLGDKNREKADRAMRAMMGMKKLDIRALRRARAGR